MLPAYHLKILSTQGVHYEADILHALVPAETGFVGVLAHHAPFVTTSSGGTLEITEKNGGIKKFQTGPGFFEVKDNQASLFTESFRS